jgi:hypothetical protein
METATGDSLFGVKTRSKKTEIDSVEDIQLLKNISNGHPEVNALVQDQIFQNFVETTVDPNHGPLTEDVSDDYIPHEESVIEADDGGSSEEDLDEEEEVNPPNDEEIAEVNLDATEGKAAMLKNVPPAMAAAYKKRFPHFWRMKDGLRVHTGTGYDHEEDPDFEEKKRDETIELSSGSESDDESSSSDEEEEEDMVKGEEVAELSSMVEDMMIPDDSILEGAVDEAIKEVDNEEESDESEESDDEIDTNEPDHLDLLDDQKDMVYEDDIEYKPIEEDVAIDESDDSYTSANEDSEESSDDESEQVETMDE